MKKILSYSILIIALSVIVITLFDSNKVIDRNKLGTSLPLVANQGELSLLIIGDSNNSSNDIREALDITNLRKITRYNSLEEFRKNHSGLTIKKTPAYVLFDSIEPIYQTYEFKKLVNYSKNIK